MQVAIDGPAGSGKSTISKTIAEKYNLLYLDTGAMYRAAAWLKLSGSLTNEELLKMLDEIDFEFTENGRVLTLHYQSNAKQPGNVTDQIRTPEVTALVSEVAANTAVRAILTKIQQKIASDADVIMEGRDIGTVVLPHADLKFFLTASAEERAKRRTEEWKGNGNAADYEKVLYDIKERDRKDSSRETAPLKKSDNAVEIDTTSLTINEVTAIIGAAINKFQNGVEG